MISFISNRITDFFITKKIIDENQKDIYQYGTEVTISTVISFLITLVSALLTGHILETAIFYVVFVYARKYNGGYHADTYLKCNIIYTINLLAVLLISVSAVGNFMAFHMFILCFSYFLVTWKFAPIDNENKPLDSDERKKYGRISRIFSVLFICIAVICYFVYPIISVVISVTLFSVSLSMIIEVFRRGGSLNEECKQKDFESCCKDKP